MKTTSEEECTSTQPVTESKRSQTEASGTGKEAGVTSPEKSAAEAASSFLEGHHSGQSGTKPTSGDELLQSQAESKRSETEPSEAVKEASFVSTEKPAANAASSLQAENHPGQSGTKPTSGNELIQSQAEPKRSKTEASETVKEASRVSAEKPASKAASSMQAENHPGQSGTKATSGEELIQSQTESKRSATEASETVKETSLVSAEKPAPKAASSLRAGNHPGQSGTKPTSGHELIQSQTESKRSETEAFGTVKEASLTSPEKPAAKAANSFQEGNHSGQSGTKPTSGELTQSVTESKRSGTEASETNKEVSLVSLEKPAAKAARSSQGGYDSEKFSTKRTDGEEFTPSRTESKRSETERSETIKEASLASLENPATKSASRSQDGNHSGQCDVEATPGEKRTQSLSDSRWNQIEASEAGKDASLTTSEKPAARNAPPLREENPSGQSSTIVAYNTTSLSPTVPKATAWHCYDARSIPRPVTVGNVRVRAALIENLFQSGRLGPAKKLEQASNIFTFVPLRLNYIASSLARTFADAFAFTAAPRAQPREFYRLVLSNDTTVKVLADVIGRAIYMRLHFIRKATVTDVGRNPFQQRPSFCEDILLPSPIARAINSIGTFRFADVATDVIYLPTLSVDPGHTGGTQAIPRLPEYIAMREELQEGGFSFSRVEKEQIEGTAWWMLTVEEQHAHAEANARVYDVVSNFPPMCGTVSITDAFIRSYCIQKNEYGVTIGDLHTLPNAIGNNYGTIFRDIQPYEPYVFMSSELDLGVP